MALLSGIDPFGDAETVVILPTEATALPLKFVIALLHTVDVEPAVTDVGLLFTVIPGLV